MSEPLRPQHQAFIRAQHRLLELSLPIERCRQQHVGAAESIHKTLWLGADRNYVPLRMLQKEPDGETIEMRIVSLR